MSESNAPRRTFLVVGIIAVGSIVLHAFGALSPLETVLIRVLAPVGHASQTIVHTIVTNTATPASRSSTELEQQIANLMAENARLQSDLAALTQSNTQHAFNLTHHYTSIQSRIFARSPDPASSYVVIDRGARDGVQIGQPAVIGEGIVVGKVISLADSTADVLLSIDNRSSFSAACASNAVAQGVVTGIQGLSIGMNLIPQSETISIHDAVLTSGIDAHVPKGLVLGEIERIDKQQGALFQSAVLHIPYTVADLDAISILTGQTS